MHLHLFYSCMHIHGFHVYVLMLVISCLFCCLQVWIMPEEPKKLFPIFRNLKDVYLYNISNDSGLDWTLFVLEGAPSLKSFHVKVNHA